MLRFTICLTIVITILVGCQHRPLLMRGAMDVSGDMSGDVSMTGDMKMNGDMNMTGDMNMAGHIATTMKSDNTASRLKAITVTGQLNGAGKIAIVDVDGPMIEQNLSGFGSMGENPVSLFHEKLEAISSDPLIQAIVLRINSPGGGVTASDIMAHDLERVKNARQIPVVACLMGVGAGGGYYLATHADAIIAHPTSVVGGIGVILNHYNLEDTMGQFNILSMPVKSGQKIDLGSPERELDDEEREWLQKMADEFHVRFINQVRQSRTQLANLENDASLFDGRVMTGDQALDQALIDQVGYLDDAIEVARRKAGLAKDAGVVMLRRDNDRAYTVLDVTPNQPMQTSLVPFKLPGLDRSALPTFLYLWQPDPSMGAKL